MKKIVPGFITTPFLVLLLFSFYFTSPAIAEESNNKQLYTGKFIDAHAHFIKKILSIDELIPLMDKSGIDTIVLFINPGDLGDALEQYPDRIIPFLSPYKYYKMERKKELTLHTISLADKELSRGIYKGFGEILLRLHKIKFAPEGINVPVDSPNMLKVYDIAAKNNTPVNLHIDNEYSDELERALEYNRKTKIIWAHCGYSNHDKIKRMLDKHPNLYGDLSILADPTKGHSRTITDYDGNLLPEWKKLFENYSNRLMFGSDMGMNRSRYDQTPEIIRHYRKLLYQLEPDAAQNLAYRTILSLLEL